jgi:hypothetical protein
MDRHAARAVVDLTPTNLHGLVDDIADACLHLLDRFNGPQPVNSVIETVSWYRSNPPSLRR